MNQAVETNLRKSPCPEERSSPAGAPPTVAHMIEMSDLDDPLAGPDQSERQGTLPLLSAFTEINSPIRHVKAKLSVRVGTAELTVGELLGIKEHQVIRLDRTPEQPVDVLLEGHVVARGTLVAVDENFAVRITELPLGFEAPRAAAKRG